MPRRVFPTAHNIPVRPSFTTPVPSRRRSAALGLLLILLAFQAFCVIGWAVMSTEVDIWKAVHR